MSPPLVAGVLTGVLRAMALHRNEDISSVVGWRRWFVTHGRVPITSVGLGAALLFSMIAAEGAVSGVAGIIDNFFEHFAMLVSFAFFNAIAGAIIGIPISAIICVLLYDAWLWIDNGGD